MKLVLKQGRLHFEGGHFTWYFSASEIWPDKRDVLIRVHRDVKWITGHHNHQVCSKSNTTGATSGLGTAYPNGAHVFTPGFKWGLCCSFFSFLCGIFSIIFCLFVLLLNNILSVHQFMTFDYPLVSYKFSYTRVVFL
jgi:hypothetical protein